MVAVSVSVFRAHAQYHSKSAFTILPLYVHMQVSEILTQSYDRIDPVDVWRFGGVSRSVWSTPAVIRFGGGLVLCPELNPARSDRNRQLSSFYASIFRPVGVGRPRRYFGPRPPPLSTPLLRSATATPLCACATDKCHKPSYLSRELSTLSVPIGEMSHSTPSINYV